MPAKTKRLLLGQNINPEPIAEKRSQILIIFIKPYKLFLFINNKHNIFSPPLSAVAVTRVEIGS